MCDIGRFIRLPSGCSGAERSEGVGRASPFFHAALQRHPPTAPTPRLRDLPRQDLLRPGVAFPGRTRQPWPEGDGHARPPHPWPAMSGGQRRWRARGRRGRAGVTACLHDFRGDWNDTTHRHTRLTNAPALSTDRQRRGRALLLSGPATAWCARAAEAGACRGSAAPGSPGAGRRPGRRPASRLPGRG